MGYEYEDTIAEIFGRPLTLKVKGKEEFVKAYRPIESIGRAAFAETPKQPLIGRKEECQVIRGMLDHLMKTEGESNSIVIFNGEAGIGKSKMMQYVHAKATKSNINVVMGAGVDTEKHSPLFVFRSILQQLLEITYQKSISAKFRLWLLDTSRQKHSKLYYSDELNDSFYSRLDALIEIEEKKVEQYVALQFLGISSDDAEAVVEKRQKAHDSKAHSKSRRHYSAPPYERLSNHLLIEILKSMIPVTGKGCQLKEMYPLLVNLLPKILSDVKDNETTAKMKKELRAENLMKLVQHIVSHFVESLSEFTKINQISEDNLSSIHKAHSLIGEEVTSSVAAAKSPSKIITGKSQLARKASRNILDIKSLKSPPKSPTKDQVQPELYEFKTRRESILDHSKPEKCILILEDLHAMDPSALYLLSQIASSVRPLAIFASSRTVAHKVGVEIGFMDNSPTVITLGNLTREEVRKGMCSWLGVKEIPDKALIAVMEKSNGHPLFSYELAKLMQQEGFLVIEKGICKLTSKAEAGIGLPDSVSALMTTKLDRVPPSQQLILKVAAVIGIKFRKNELLALLPKGTMNDDIEEESRGLKEDIIELVDSGLLVQDAYTKYHYKFTNAMLCESAYNLLLFQTRKDLHKKLAEFHEDRNKEYLEPVYSLLATNYFLAEVNDKAVHYSELAGNDALDLHGMQQVLICFSRLIDLDKRYPVVTVHIPLVRKVGWNRKIGEALFHMGKPKEAQSFFCDALVMANLRPEEIDSSSAGCFSILRKPAPMRLVRNMPSFKSLVEKGDVEMLLEAASAYELLGKINNDRQSAAALEYRLNALDIAVAADEYMSKTQGDRYEAPSELARSYAFTAVFYVGIKSKQARTLSLAKSYIETAANVVDNVKDSETQALVHFKYSEFSTMIGDLKAAGDGLRKASWVSQFLNFERMNLECQELAVAVLTFEGNLLKAKQTVMQAVEKMNEHSPSYTILALGARVAIFLNDYDFAESALEKIGRLEKGSFAKSPSESALKIMATEIPETMMAMSLLLTRKYSMQGLALASAIRGAELLKKVDISALPISMFHTLVFLLTAFYESIGDVPLHHKRKQNQEKWASSSGRLKSFSQVRPYEEATTSLVLSTSKSVRKNAQKLIVFVIGVMKQYASVYQPCMPHCNYSLAMYKKMITGRPNLGLFNTAAMQAAESKTKYVEALSLFEMAKINNQYVIKAEEAFHACVGKPNNSSNTPQAYEMAVLSLIPKNIG